MWVGQATASRILLTVELRPFSPSYRLAASVHGAFGEGMTAAISYGESEQVWKSFAGDATVHRGRSDTVQGRLFKRPSEETCATQAPSENSSRISSRSSSPALSEVSVEDAKKDFRCRSRGRTPSPCPSESRQETYHMVFAKGCSLERFAATVAACPRGRVLESILSSSFKIELLRRLNVLPELQLVRCTEV
eukprot:s5132_g3.t2